jgi:hypothetical protein
MAAVENKRNCYIATLQKFIYDVLKSRSIKGLIRKIRILE